MFFWLGCSCFSIFKGFFQNSKGFKFNFNGRCSWQAFVLCLVLFIFSWGCNKQLFFTLLGKFLLNVFFGWVVHVFQFSKGSFKIQRVSNSISMGGVLGKLLFCVWFCSFLVGAAENNYSSLFLASFC